MAVYMCAVCGTVALPTNSNLVDGMRFVHRACDIRPATRRRHAFFCTDDGCRGECWPEPAAEPREVPL